MFHTTSKNIQKPFFFKKKDKEKKKKANTRPKLRLTKNNINSKQWYYGSRRMKSSNCILQKKEFLTLDPILSVVAVRICFYLNVICISMRG